MGKLRAPNPSVTYVGMDTETGPDGRAFLACTPTRWADIRSWKDAEEFLLQDRDYVCWNASFDGRALFAWLPKRCLRDLHVSRRTTYRGTTVEVHTEKHWSVRRGKARCDTWDAYPYYESGLDAAAARWLDEGKSGAHLDKSDMPHEYHARPGVVREYCARDARLTQQLWERFEAQITELGISPYRANSPATLARRYFADSFRALREAPKATGLFEPSYFGGRNEVYWRGRIPGPVYAYDIRSAYPTALATLPVPTGHMERLDGREPTDALFYAAYHVRVNIRPDVMVGPVPARRPDGTLFYPTGVFYVVISAADHACLHAGGHEHRHLGGYGLIPDAPATPLFPGIAELYALRRARPDLSLGIKKLLNSTYGKTAETVRRWIPEEKMRDGDIMPSRKCSRGRYVRSAYAARGAYFPVAAAVTAACRRTIYRLAMQRPDAIVSISTDGILSRAPLAADLGEELGQWEAAVWSGAVIVGNGVYMLHGPDGWEVKCRGARLDTTAFMHLFLTIPSRRSPILTLPTLKPLTFGECAAQGYRNLNAMLPGMRQLDCNMDTKRVWPRKWRSVADMMRSEPMQSETYLHLDMDALRPYYRRTKGGRA